MEQMHMSKIHQESKQVHIHCAVNDQRNIRNALHLAMISPREEEHVELARLLVEKGQVDPMGSVRQSGVVHSYAGPVEAFRYLIHQDEFLVDPEERNRSGRTI